MYIEMNVSTKTCYPPSAVLHPNLFPLFGYPFKIKINMFVPNEKFDVHDTYLLTCSTRLISDIIVITSDRSIDHVIIV